MGFAEFEEKNKDVERERWIYKFAPDHVAKGGAEELCRKFVAFGKAVYKEWIEDGVVGKRRFEYEDEVRKNYLNYNAGFDYMRLEESLGG